MWKRESTSEKNIFCTSLILSHHHSHIHPSFLSLFKKHIEGGRKKKEKKRKGGRNIKKKRARLRMNKRNWRVWKVRHSNFFFWFVNSQVLLYFVLISYVFFFLQITLAFSVSDIIFYCLQIFYSKFYKTYVRSVACVAWHPFSNFLFLLYI